VLGSSNNERPRLQRVIEREALTAARNQRTLTQDFCGDPPPGYSALHGRLTSDNSAASLAALNQASSGRWMSLKVPVLVALELCMALLQTTHVAASASFLGTSEGVVK
jgi:hypothetical protein